jgi:uncharacterized protein YggT (Ycf19 family)
MNTVTVLGYVQVMAIYIGMLLIGQGAVYLLSFGKHESNAVYKLFTLVTSPVLKLVRLITPSQVSDKHLPFVGFLLMFWIAFGLAVFIPTFVPATTPK